MTIFFAILQAMPPAQQTYRHAEQAFVWRSICIQQRLPEAVLRTVVLRRLFASRVLTVCMIEGYCHCRQRRSP